MRIWGYMMLLLAVNELSAQNIEGKKSGREANFEQAERFTSMKFGMLVGSMNVTPHFINGSDRFWYSFKTGDGTRYYYVDPKTNVKKELFNRERLAGDLSRWVQKEVKGNELFLPNLVFSKDDREVEFRYAGKNFRYDLKKEVLLLDTGKREIPVSVKKKVMFGKYSPDSAYVAYVKCHDLYVMRVKDSIESRLTFDGERYFSYGSKGDDTTSGSVETRAEWFGDSKKMYVIREDLRKVGELPLISISGKRPTVRTYKTALAGDVHVPQYEASVCDVVGGRQVKVKMEKWKDQLLWLSYAGKSSNQLFIQRKKRTREELEICAVNTETGDVRVVIHEKSLPYLNDDLYSIAYLNDGSEILWWSERSGWGNYYLYDSRGNLKNQVTSGEWTSGKIVRIDTTRRVLYFEGYGQVKGGNRYYARLNRVDLDGKGNVKMLTPEEGNHQVTFSPSGRYFVDTYSRPDQAPRNVLRDWDGKLIRELEAPDLRNLYETGWRKPECFTVKAADDCTDLYGVMYKPMDFDSTKRYPVISYVYPGPWTEYIPVDFECSSLSGAPQLAQVGFVVVCFGNRGGSPYRGRVYHSYGYGNLRDYPLADNKYGLEQLIGRYSFIDSTRVGIFGHSGGGAMAVTAICTYPDFYKAAVASSGNHDNTIYDYGWSEIHHGIKEVQQGDSVSFEFCIKTNIELAKQLKGHLMLVTGDADDNVNPANTLRLVNALIIAKKDFELVLLPGQKHGYMGPAKDFYYRKMWQHFARYLLEVKDNM